MPIMKWFRIVDRTESANQSDGHFITHLMPEQLRDGILADLLSRGLKKYELDPTSEFVFEIPGMRLQDGYWFDLRLDGFKVTVSAPAFPTLYKTWADAQQREAGVLPYYKFHSQYGCLCIIPEQRTLLLQDMESLLDAAQRRCDAEHAELERRMAGHRVDLPDGRRGFTARKSPPEGTD